VHNRVHSAAQAKWLDSIESARWSGYPRRMGFFDSLSKGWRFMKEAFAMARADRTLLKPSVYSVAIGADIDWAADVKDKGPAAQAPLPLARVLNR
jgi:hypothetical protein